MADLDFLKYFKTPDLVTPLSVGLEMAERHQNARTQRMFAENEAARQSADEKRKQQEFDAQQADRKRKNAIEDANMIGTIGVLQHTNPGAAAALANSIGASVVPQDPLTASAPGMQGPPPETADSFLAEHPVAEASSEEDLSQRPSGEPVVEGPHESAAEYDRDSAKPGDLEQLMSRATSDHSGPAGYPSSELPKSQIPPNPLMDVVLGGQHYPIPAQAPGTGLGQKYDDLYHHALAAGYGDQDAKKLAFTMFSKDNDAQNIADRTSAGIVNREVQKEKYGDKFIPSADQRQKNFDTSEQGRNDRNAANNRARIEAAAMMGGPRQEQADTGKRTQYMGAVKEAKAAAGANADIKTLKNVEKIDEEIGNKSLVAQNAAKDTLAQIAQGGKASLAVMKQFDNSLSFPQEIEDKWYQKVHGTHSPTWLNNYRETVRGLKDVLKTERGRAMDAFESAAGANSPYATDPEVGPHVTAQRKAYRSELGIPDTSGSDDLKADLDKLIGGK